jgi:rhamnose utilization protein RhaD (predicted bifunctional aldolase and dehydrogenase)
MTSAEFDLLRASSARLGANPLLVQAAGGNTSIKQDGVMWIKASGTWLRDAVARDIFVPLDLARLSRALAEDDPACESCTDYVRADLNPSGLHPSIETSVHGLMPQRVVIHVHCVNTIAHAIQVHAQAALGPKLSSFTWAYVPYARPGLMLSHAIKNVLRKGVNVLVLGNHGLAVAADTVADTEALLMQVVTALQLPATDVAAPNLAKLHERLQGSAYRLPSDVNCHAIALIPATQELGCNNVYYPDHVVFLGTRIPPEMESGAPAIAIPAIGTLVRADAKPSIEPMLRCIGDVMRRIPPGARLNALTAQHIDQLLNWDAEKYRQTLPPQ